MNAQALRRIGSAALDLCYVAAGRFDGFWELNLGAWDSAAGALIVEEAGGRVTDFSGGPFSNFKPEILASNGLIHAQMMKVLAMAKG
jgi:myo-inositol-1(or 4)-monophosphatase